VRVGAHVELSPGAQQASWPCRRSLCVILGAGMDELLSLREVRLHYLRGRRHVVRVLDRVSLRVWAGEVVCVLARRGQGKTTLLRVAAGMVRPAGGQVAFAGKDLWEMPERHRSELIAGEIAWVKRKAPELDAPVLQRLAMPQPGGRHWTQASVLEALERVGASHCAALEWESLSDRERSLVAVAAAIVRKPRLVLADDLTVGLSALETDEVMHLLTSLAKERNFGVLASVGSAKETRWADRIATLTRGELIIARPYRMVAGNEADIPT
jgi:ABC-type cobalamin/Fe3+-siderophores transport system ATPase subunit